MTEGVIIVEFVELKKYLFVRFLTKVYWHTGSLFVNVPNVTVC